MNEIWTIGHSTRSLAHLFELLEEHRIQVLGDVRRFPTSRRSPHFNKEVLATDLPQRGLEYRHLEGLGGLRGDYFAYTKTAEFDAALKDLLWTAVAKRTALMCAEASWQRCHRRFIADALVLRGVAVHHILAPGVAVDHVVRGVPLEEFA
jgi:uncharacterized protein (DUF488 family)